jgi:hypothetical protein
MKNKIFSLKNLIWFCAIGLATFSGYYSVFGISKLFSGGSWSIIGMAAMLEFSKLVVITFLHDHYKDLKMSFKLYLTSAASVLMIITSIGVYGYLTNSYQETAKHIYETQNTITLLDQKKNIFNEQKSKIDTLVKQKTDRINSYDKLRLSQENVLNSQITQKGSTRGLQKNIQSVDKSTQTLNDEISQLNQKSINLSDSVALIEQEKLSLSNSTFTSELGPLLYLSRITGLSMDMVVNWFILILVVVFDPLAVSLVIAANHLAKKDNDLVKGDELEIKAVESQITDAVTTPQVVQQVDEIDDNIETEFKKKIKKERTTKEKKNYENEKKNLEMIEKSSILEESLKNESAVETNTENFYGETVHPKFEYRRGVKI